MKRIILFLSIILLTISSNGQNISGTVGITQCFEINKTTNGSTPTTVDVGVGIKSDDKTMYVGLGFGLGNYEAYMGEIYDNNKCYGYGIESHLIIPCFFELSYVEPKSFYFDVKIGCENIINSNKNDVLYFINVTPIGYSFDEHNSIGIGYRFHGKKAFDKQGYNGHGISLSYRLTF